MLSYLKKQLSQKERKEVIRYMTQHKNLEAIIESRELDLQPSRTTHFDENPVQKSFTFNSEAETFAIKSEKIDEYKRVKRQLDLAYQSIKPIQKLIWDERFVEGRADADLYYGHNIPKRTYYREKNELISVVAECLGIGGGKNG